MIKAVAESSFEVTNDISQVLVLYPVVEGLGITAYDPLGHVGGALHFVKPDSKENPETAKQKPAMFADTGIPAFLWQVFRSGATRKSLQVKLAGGSRMFKGKGVADQNVLMAKRVLWRNAVVVANEVVGGLSGLHIRLELATGRVFVKANNVEMPL